jgi:putative nonproteinogenic amino acid hydroxylase
MKSRLLATIPLDSVRLKRDLQALDQAYFRDDYLEYTFGAWRSYVLANPTGDETDARFRPSDAAPLITALGRRMPYVLSLIDTHFDTRTLRWSRIFTVQDALLVPHRDFLEFDRPLHRLHLVLDTDPSCLHSEYDVVYHMRQGEIWEVDGLSIHAACTLSCYRRISLVLDFEQDGTPAESRIRATGGAPQPSPQILDLPTLSEAEIAAIRGLRAIARNENFRDVVNLLGKVHFYRKTSAAAMFDWLEHVFQDDPAALARACAYRRFCVDERQYQERFGDDAA